MCLGKREREGESERVREKRGRKAKTMAAIRSLAVVGAGQMGSGIAQVSMMNEFVFFFHFQLLKVRKSIWFSGRDYFFWKGFVCCPCVSYGRQAVLSINGLPGVEEIGYGKIKNSLQNGIGFCSLILGIKYEYKSLGLILVISMKRGMCVLLG